MKTENDPSLAYTLPFQLTKKLHRKPYDSILPINNDQSGRIILITGGGSGIGAVWTNSDGTISTVSSIILQHDIGSGKSVDRCRSVRNSDCWSTTGKTRESCNGATKIARPAERTHSPN
jgi:hypothetical protein